MHADEDLNQGASGGISYDGKIAGLYDLEETLGSGHFAVVKLARHVFTGAKVAVKVVDKTKLDEVSKSHLFQEVRCMKLVQHPNVVRLYEVIDTQTKLYLVLELGDGGDLYDYIMKHENGLSEDLAKKYFRQIVKAISYCHQLHVVHRDLKPENVVFFEKLGIVKLTDFGFSNKFSPGQKLETSCGSLAYSAPEILLGDSYDAPAVDVWSLGVILYMLVCGQPPFEKANDSETLTMIMDCKYTVPPHITVACRKLIATMLVRDPEGRASLEEIANDPWLQQSASNESIDYLPLVSRQEISEDDHAFILHKMINGKIATKEEILQALDKNKYNHITATYFLLAELRLRKRREEHMKKNVPKKTESSLMKKQSDVGRLIGADSNSILEENKLSIPLNLTGPAGFGGFSGHANQMEKRDRKCSIVREEDEDDTTCDYNVEKNQLKVAVPRRESISDGRLNKLVQERVIPSVVMPIAVVNATLAEKFRQIEPYKEGLIVPKITTLSPMVEASGNFEDMKINKYKQTSATKNPVLTHRKTKLNKIRTPSCSSSEASDDDTKTRSKKKLSNKFVGDTPTRFRMHRRDSHDDSSDSQDQSTFPSTNTQLSNIITTTANTSGNGKKSEQHKDKNCKSDDTRKSSHSHTKQKKQMREQGKPTLVYKLGSIILGRSRRMRESQSLDRIAEAQEYVQRRRYSGNHGNSLYNLSSLSVTEIKEEYDEELDNNEDAHTNMAITTKNGVQNEMQLQKLEEGGRKVSNLDSINEIDLVIGLTKAIQVSQSRCSVSIKKIRRLEKYLPVVNFS